MFGRKKEEVNFEKIDTLIGKDTILEGNINAKGTIRIDGKVIGEVNCQGDVVVGEGGVIEAGLKARNILVAGVIRGDVEAQGKIELTATGSVHGDISVSSLIIDDGAVFEGNCSMKGDGSVKKVEKNRTIEK